MIRHNIAANVAARAWGVISAYLFVPLYLDYLGIEAYGLVGFYTTLLGVAAFADMGFTATLNREMARLSVRTDSAGEMEELLRTYELAYLCLSSVLAIMFWGLAPAIAGRWLRSTVLQPHEIAAAIRLMGFAIAFQLPAGLYIGGLMGLQRQGLASVIQIAWSVFRGAGAVLVLSILSPTLFAFALWQLISNAVYCFFARRSLWRALASVAGRSQAHFQWRVLRDTWRYAAGMAGMALISTLLTQTDKLAVSKLLSLEMLGYYTLAGALASAPLMLASPIVAAVFPRFTGLVATGDLRSLTALYHRTCEVVAVAIIPGGLTLALFAGDFIFAWTGSPVAAQRAGLAASLSLGGQLVQGILVTPYYLALAHGNVTLYLYMGIASVVLVTPLLITLIPNFGLVGAGLSWLVVNLCTLPFYVYFIHRRFMPGEARRWCLWDVGRPLLAALPCAALCRWLLPHTPSRMATFCLIAMVWALSAAASAATVAECRKVFMKTTNRWFEASYGMQD